MNAERIELRTLAPQPWKNGAGLTREIAVAGEAGASGAFDWRISCAAVARDAPFSAFPGVDRCIVLLRGAGLRLRSRDGAIDHRLTTPLAPFRFAGEAALDATVVDGPCDDLNVMTRRGAFTSEVQVHRHAATIDEADAALLLAIDGRWSVGGERAPLAPMHALLWRAPSPPVATRPLDAAAALIAVRLCHDRGS